MELFFHSVDLPHMFVPLSESLSQPSLENGAEPNDNGGIAATPVGLFQGPADDTPTSREVLSDYTPSPTAPLPAERAISRATSLQVTRSTRLNLTRQKAKIKFQVLKNTGVPEKNLTPHYPEAYIILLAAVVFIVAVSRLAV